MSLRVLVEYCTKDRTENGSFTLRGTESTYLDYFKQLTTLINLRLPYVQIEENTEELFQAIRSSENALEAQRQDVAIPRPPPARMPRIGAFEVYLKMDVMISEGPSQCRAERMKLVSSKIHSKRWPKVNRITDLLVQAIENETQEFVLRSLDSCRNYYADQVRPLPLVLLHSICDDRAGRSSIPASEHLRDLEVFQVVCAVDQRNAGVPSEPSERLGALRDPETTKLRICGVRALVEDLELALAATGQPASKRADSTQFQDPSREKKEQPSRQVAYEIKAYSQFLHRHVDALAQKPSQIYMLASRMPLPGLDALKKDFLGGLTDLQNLSTKIDEEDRDCTPEELMKFVNGTTNLAWAASVGFLHIFSTVEQRWMNEVEMVFKARLVLQQEACLELLRRDGRKCRSLLEVVRNGTMRDVSQEGKFALLSEMLSEVKQKMTQRVRLCVDDPDVELSAEEGGKMLEAVLDEFCSARNTAKVDVALERDGQCVRQLEDGIWAYFVTVGFSALPMHSNALEKLFNSFIQALGDDELAAMMPNRTTLTRAGVGHDIDMLILIRLPNSLVLDDDEFKHGVLEDIRAASSYNLAADTISLQYASRCQLVVRVNADLLPTGTAPQAVAQELAHQLHNPSSALVSDDRTVLHHTIWVGYGKGGCPLRVPGVFTQVQLRVSGIPKSVDDPQVERFCQLVLPALLTTCRTKGLILSLLSDGRQVTCAPTELCVKVLPDGAVSSAGSAVSVVVATLTPPDEDEQNKTDESHPPSAAQKKRRDDSRGLEVEAVAAFNRVADVIGQLYPSLSSPVAMPAHLQEGQLQTRCLEALTSQTKVLAHPAVAEAIDEVCREAVSTDISAPAVVMVHGATAQTRAVALAGVVRQLVGAGRPSDNSFVSYFFKPKGMALHHVLSHVTCDLWLQLLGGRHMRMRGEEHGCGIADLCDVVHRAADSTVDPIEKSYLRVVLVLDGLSPEEQVQVAEGILSRPRLFPILSCAMSTDHAAATGQLRGSVARRMRMVTNHVHTKILPLPPVPDASSGDGSDASRRAAFSAVLDDIDHLLGDAPKEHLMCQLVTLPGLLEAELRMRLAPSSGHVLSHQLDAVTERLRPFLELYPLLRHGSVILAQDCCVEVMKRYLIPYMDGFAPESLKSLAQMVSSRQASPYIDAMLVPTSASDADEATDQTIEQVGQYWGSLEMSSFFMDRKRYKDWVVAENRSSQLKLGKGSSRLAQQRQAWEQGASQDADAQSENLMYDKEIGDVMRMSQKSFASPAPHARIDQADSLSRDALAARPWSAEPRRAHSRMEDDRHRPRTATSFRYKDDTVVDRRQAGTPSPSPAKRLFQDGRRGLSRSVEGEGRRRASPAQPESQSSADPWSTSQTSWKGGTDAPEGRRYRGVGDVSSSPRQTPVTPDLEQTVQPYMQPWMYPKRPQQLEKDWVFKDKGMNPRRLKPRYGADPAVSIRDTASQTSTMEPVYLSEIDALAAKLLSGSFTRESSAGRSAAQQSPQPLQAFQDYSSWSGLDVHDAEVAAALLGASHASSFANELQRAVAREALAKQRTDTRIAFLSQVTRQRAAQREHRKSLITDGWRLHKETPEARREKAQKRAQGHERHLAAQKKARKERHGFREHVRASYVKWDALAEAERKEFERLLREAVASRPAFDAYEHEKELEQQRAAKKKERELRKAEPVVVEPDPAQLEAEQQRRRNHEEQLVKRYGMTLTAEQCGAVTQLRDFGVRIHRADQPATIMIGQRRLPVKKHRHVRGRILRDEQSGEEERVGETTVREHFVMQVIPTGKYESATDSFVGGGYMLRVRYSNLKEKKPKGGVGKVVYEGLTRQRPIQVLVKGSDGYQAAWSEEPSEGTNSYTGVLETGAIVPAESHVRDFVEIEGYFPAARESEEVWKLVKDVIEVEFFRS